ncbi:MAG: zinc-dependent alcohol dehydrogenase family protein [Gemmatales bacterium]|nr:zinc-dependent alcohol dehydrogenase family protein [Gemmatales bacterium]MCS7159410.1 zinc-dependent alcohol dehydrogenase family protein [Gemmatales bacterium]MDW8174609.1 zinc-dependent alcohol dehydrogenase family protein [Gemmatales bacterium]MDW8222753.1 zinc-dependent alcohol dehydrogenase family protein [Gemmatales bacterium]
MRALVFDRFGEPSEVLQLRELPPPRPGPGQVRVRMIASPINPSDLLLIRGAYGQRTQPPAVPGFEGVGVVEESGGGFLGWRVLGKRVAVLNSHGGNWQEQVVIPARQAVPVPDDLPEEQVASFFVNPATALVMITRVLQVPRGEWLLQTAANSALGKMIIRLGHALGFHTINVVRRPEARDELRSLRPDAVILWKEGDDLSQQLRDQLPQVNLRYAVDAVGGLLGSQIISCLGFGGRLVVYGTLSGQPLQFSPRELMVNSRRIEGFWLAEWTRNQGPLSMLRLFRQIARWMRRGVLVTEVAAQYPLERFQEAIQRAQTSGRSGKVLLRFGPVT